ncbi:MAG: hypothetical protein ACK53L_19090, partial [Pirellulaceae bacterium]
VQRDSLIAQANASYDNSLAAAAALRQAALDGANAVFEAAKGNILATRNAALAIAKANFDGAVAVADFVYRNGPQDEAQTGALDVAGHPAYQQALASAKATYLAAVERAE